MSYLSLSLGFLHLGTSFEQILQRPKELQEPPAKYQSRIFREKQTNQEPKLRDEWLSY